MFIALLAFMLFASPFMFQATRMIFGPWVASPEGVPSVMGLLLHAIVFIVVTKILSFKTSAFTSREDQNDENTKMFQQNRIVYQVGGI